MRTTNEQRWVLGLTAAGSVIVALDVLVVAAALTTIQSDLGASVSQLEWTMNAYGLSFAVLLMTAAAVGDRWGRRRTYVAGLVIFSLASAACALASSVGWLIAARAVQGVGAAVVMPLAIGLLGAAFPAERRGWALGIFSGVTGLAVLGEPVIGGAVTEGLDWQWIFWISLPVGLVAIPLALRKVPESTGPTRRLDLRGAALITVAALGLVWGVSRGAAAGWSSAEVLTSFVIGVLFLIGFVLWEARAPQLMVPIAFFRTRTLAAANLAGFFLTAALFSAVFLMSQYMQAGLGSDPFVAGLQLLPWTATLFVIGPLAGRLVARLGERPLVVAGLALQGAGLWWISAATGGAARYSELVVPLVVAGFGISMAMPATQGAGMGALPREAVGIAFGVFSMNRQLGGAAGVAVVSAVFAASGGFAGQGFARAMTGCAVLSLLGAIFGAGITARRPGADGAASAVRPGVTETVG